MAAYGGYCGHHIGQRAADEPEFEYTGYHVTSTVGPDRAPMYVRLPVAGGQPQGVNVWRGGGAGSGAAVAQSAQQRTGAQGVQGPPRPGAAGTSTATTLMVRNLPRRVVMASMIKELDLNGFAGSYDLLAIPCYSDTGNSKGYAFLNFHSSVMARCFAKEWDRSQRFGLDGRSRLSVCEAEIQGFAANDAWWGAKNNGRAQLFIVRKLASDVSAASSSAAPANVASLATQDERATSSHAASGLRQENKEIAPAAPPAWALPMPAFVR